MCQKKSFVEACRESIDNVIADSKVIYPLFYIRFALFTVRFYYSADAKLSGPRDAFTVKRFTNNVFLELIEKR